jgi:dCTP deaminase
MLTKDEILLQVTLGNICIDPFDITNLGPNSYDLTLSPNILVYNIQQFPLDLKKEPISVSKVIPSCGLVLFPNELYLGCTNERTKSDLYIPMIEGRSSLARLGISIHQTGGVGDIGFNGHWTLEITVIHPVKVYSNIRCAQIIWFSPTGSVSTLYTGKYQHSSKSIPVVSKMSNESK